MAFAWCCYGVAMWLLGGCFAMVLLGVAMVLLGVY